MTHIRMKKTRAQTQEAKQQGDVSLLQLHSLLNWVMRLMQVVLQSLEFTCKPLQLDLVSFGECNQQLLV